MPRQFTDLYELLDLPYKIAVKYLADNATPEFYALHKKEMDEIADTFITLALQCRSVDNELGTRAIMAIGSAMKWREQTFKAVSYDFMFRKSVYSKIKSATQEVKADFLSLYSPYELFSKFDEPSDDFWTAFEQRDLLLQMEVFTSYILNNPQDLYIRRKFHTLLDNCVEAELTDAEIKQLSYCVLLEYNEMLSVDHYGVKGRNYLDLIQKACRDKVDFSELFKRLDVMKLVDVVDIQYWKTGLSKAEAIPESYEHIEF